jgi:hypothetical protein
VAPRWGGVPGETVAVAMTCGLALGVTPGARLLAFASLITIPGLSLIAYPRRIAG